MCRLGCASPRFQMPDPMSPDALSLLDRMVSNLLTKALQAGGEKAEERSSLEIRICDLRPFMQDQLQLDVVGFAVDDLLDEAGVGSRAVVQALKRKDSNKKHQQ